MRFSVLLAATAATIVAAQVDLGDIQKCSDPQGLSSCAAPYVTNVQDCGTNIPCLCKAALGGQQCFSKYCPEVTFPYSAELQAECNGSGSGSSSGSGSGSSSGTSSSGSGSGSGSGSSTSSSGSGSASSTDAPTNGDSNSNGNGNTNTNTAPKSGGNQPGAGASIFAPAGSLLAAIVVVAAML